MPVSERQFDVSPAVAFAWLTDASRFPEWLVGAKEVHPSPTWPEPGSSFHHRVGFGPLRVDDRTTVTELQPPHALELVVRARPFLEARVRFDVVASSDGTGCTIRLTEQPLGPWSIPGPLMAPMLKARNDRSLQRLARAIGVGGRSG